MNKTFRIAILYLAVVVFLAQGCNAANLATASPTDVAQNQVIVLQTAPPTAPVEVPAASQGDQAQGQPASLEGFVWDDLDRDGLQDLNEKGYPMSR